MKLRVKTIAVALIALLALWPGFAAPTGAKKKTAAKSTARKSTAKKTSSKSSPAKKSTSKAATRKAPAKSSSRYSRGRKTTPPRPRGQMEPAPDRYREIQQALVEKGYLRSDPSGKWDADSMDALKRFQEDQNLDASGKLDSLSLIALGLGPQRNNTSAQARPQ